MPSSDAIDSFITRWENSGAAERANYQMFLSELCDIIGVPRPDPTSPEPAKNLHVFDRAITRVMAPTAPPSPITSTSTRPATSSAKPNKASQPLKRM
jgi:hypothetical protein